MTDQSADIILQKNVNLASFNTLNVSAEASLFFSVTSVQQLQKILRETPYKNYPLFVLGEGSNVLFVHDFEGLILHMNIPGKEITEENENYIRLKIGAGENWHETVCYCVENGWGGIENLSLIPGSVGAAPIQNIGAYGVELEDVFDSLGAVHIESGQRKVFTGKECEFGYRDSIFKNELKGKYIITDVTLKLTKEHVLNTSYGAIQNKIEEMGLTDPTIKDISEIVMGIRNSKLPDPGDLGNAGSFFKNPIISQKKYEQLKDRYPGIPGYKLSGEDIKVPAGWLIEQAGWKGKVVGNVGTYDQQALVIVNHGEASGEEILQLATDIKASVKDKFAVELVPEVNIVS